MSTQAIDRRPFRRNHGDLRASTGRRWHVLYRDLATELGGDLSPAREALLRRLCTLLVLAEQADAALTEGREITLADALRTSSEARSLMSRLGLATQRKPADDDDEVERLLREVEDDE